MRKKVASNESQSGSILVVDEMTVLSTVMVLFFRLLTLFYLSNAFAVPISFLKTPAGNMHDTQWHLLQNSWFQVYYPEHAEGAAQSAMDSLEKAYPYLSRMLGVCIKNDNTDLVSCPFPSKFDRISLVLGDRWEQGGFANPVTQNIEILAKYPKQPSFFQHELVHRLMYEHHDFHVGPLGRVFSLAMVPTWWIEGLAEYLTESIGTVETESWERSMAMEHDWPSWESLHGLYHGNSDRLEKGYVTSGRFVGWIMAKQKNIPLSQSVEQLALKTVRFPFYQASDAWLEENFQKAGKQLYSEFQKSEEQKWNAQVNHMPSLLLSSNGLTYYSQHRQYESFPEKNKKQGYALSNGSHRLLVPWHHVLAIVDVPQGKKEWHLRAAFPDWVTKIDPDRKNDDFLFAVVRKKEGYQTHHIDLLRAEKHFMSWAIQEKKADTKFQMNDFQYDTEPPFLKLAKQDVSLKSSFEHAKAMEEKDPILDKKDAPYENHFLFAYPYALPDLFGGPSVNLIAVPLQDRMERYRVVLNGGYHFFLHAPNGALIYDNNRLWDRFSVSLYSRPFFNGFYDTAIGTEQTARTFNELQQAGLGIAGMLIARPYPINWSWRVGISQLSPYPSLSRAPPFVGPQTTSLASVESSFSSIVWDRHFLVDKKDGFDFSDLHWQNTFQLGFGKFNGLSPAQDSQGNELGVLDYSNVHMSLVSSIFFELHQLSLSGKISTTQGPKTFYLKEFYSPYQTYILGADNSSDTISYPILNQSSLFDLRLGNWSYVTSLSYEFPIWPDFESLFLMSYVNQWRGVLSLTEGGVSPEQQPTCFSSQTSISLGSSVTVDIKGFQLYPSLIYSRLLSNGGWSLLMQVKLMDII